MGKMPASLFYWGDFVRDPNVRRCTHAEVGVWIRTLCLMFEAERKGVLSTNGVPWTDEEICLAIGGRYEETLNCVTALVTKGVASRNEDGSLVSRRMYRDEKEREDTKERVRRHREKQIEVEECNAQSNGIGNANVRQCTEDETETETEVVLSSSKNSKADCEEIYAAYPRKVGRGAALKAIDKAFRRLIAGEGQYKFVPAEANAFLLHMAEAYAASGDGNRGSYTPHPATWFNGSRYLDNPEEWNDNGGSNGKRSNGGGRGRGIEGNDESVRQYLADRGIDEADGGGDTGFSAATGGGVQSNGHVATAGGIRGSAGGLDAGGDRSGLFEGARRGDVLAAAVAPKRAEWPGSDR